MKKQILSLVAISSTFLVVACTPPDNPVTSPSECLQIRNCANSEKGRKIGAKGKSTGFSRDKGAFPLENYPLSSYLVERQIEVVELLKLATGTADVLKTQLRLDRPPVDQTGLERVFLASAEEVEFENYEMEWKTKTSKKYEVSYLLDGDLLSSATIKGGSQKFSTDSTSKKRNYVNLFDDSYEVSVSVNFENSNLLDVEAKNIAGSISGATGGANVVHKISFALKMQVDRASVNTDTVKVVKSSVNMKFPNPSGKGTHSSDLYAEEGFVINYSGLCSSAEGILRAQAGPKNTYKVVFSKDDIKIQGKSWSRPLADCGKRPTIDLGRFLNP